MDNKALIILLFILMGRKADKQSYGLNSLGSFLKDIEVDPDYTVEKVNIAKKIGPYFPEGYIPNMNKSIAITEKFIKINELLDFMKEDEHRYISEHIPIDNNKDRISKIISTIQNEAPKSGINRVGTVVDLIINMDKYQKMLGLLTSIMNKQNGLKDPSELISLIGPLLSDGSPESDAKLKEMANMFGILKALDTPKEEKSMEEPEEASAN